MADYIEREALLAEIGRLSGWYGDDLFDAVRAVEEAPAADVAPVVHGRWEEAETLGMTFWRCSQCKFPNYGGAAFAPHKFCPNCGAKMDGSAEG